MANLDEQPEEKPGERPGPPSRRQAGQTLHGDYPSSATLIPASKIRPMRRRGDPNDRTMRSKSYLAIGFLVALIFYFIVLVTAFFYKPGLRSSTAKHAPPPAPPTLTEPDLEVLAPREEANLLRESIRNWHAASYAVEEAYQMIEKKDFVRAEKVLERALTRSPEFIDLHLAAARLYMAKRDYNKAKIHLVAVLDRNPDSTSTKLMLATALSSQENQEAAGEVANWILRDEPYSIEAHRVAATAHLSMGNPREALPHLRKIVTLGGSDELVENKLARVYRQLGQYDKAVEVLKQTLERNSGSSISYFNLAVCYAHQGRSSDAVEILDRAAAGFGASYVRPWIDSADFDPIREDELFDLFVNRVGRTEKNEYE